MIADLGSLQGSLSFIRILVCCKPLLKPRPRAILLSRISCRIIHCLQVCSLQLPIDVYE